MVSATNLRHALFSGILTRCGQKSEPAFASGKRSRSQLFDLQAKSGAIKGFNIRGLADDSITLLPVTFIIVHDNGLWNEFQLIARVKKSLGKRYILTLIKTEVLIP